MRLAASCGWPTPSRAAGRRRLVRQADAVSCGWPPPSRAAGRRRLVRQTDAVSCGWPPPVAGRRRLLQYSDSGGRPESRVSTRTRAGGQSLPSVLGLGRAGGVVSFSDPSVARTRTRSGGGVSISCSDSDGKARPACEGDSDAFHSVGTRVQYIFIAHPFPATSSPGRRGASAARARTAGGDGVSRRRWGLESDDGVRPSTPHPAGAAILGHHRAAVTAGGDGV